MEPNNIENQITEKLNAREIQPSAQAWDRLDAMLTVAEEKKTNRFPFWFIGIAASVLVLVTVGLFFFNQEKTMIIPANEIVVMPEVETTINKVQPIVEQDQVATIENKSPISTHQSETNNQGVSISNQKNNQKNNQNPVINRKKEIEYLVSGDVAALKNLPQIMKEDAIIVLPRKQEITKKATYIDVDALLASAENSNISKVKFDKIKVDANTLLSNADAEVETSFREKVIKKINKNYQEVKSALATRNQE